MRILTPEKVGEIKAHWKAGRSITDIARLTRVNRLTATRYVNIWKKTGEAKKGENQQIIDKIIEEKTLRIAAKNGLTKEKVIKKINQFLDAERKDIVKGKVGEDEDSVLIDMVPDYKTQVEGTKLAVEILGMKVNDEKKANAMEDFVNILGDL